MGNQSSSSSSRQPNELDSPSPSPFINPTSPTSSSSPATSTSIPNPSISSIQPSHSSIGVGKRRPRPASISTSGSTSGSGSGASTSDRDKGKDKGKEKAREGASDHFGAGGGGGGNGMGGENRPTMGRKIVSALSRRSYLGSSSQGGTPSGSRTNSFQGPAKLPSSSSEHTLNPDTPSIPAPNFNNNTSASLIEGEDVRKRDRKGESESKRRRISGIFGGGNTSGGAVEQASTQTPVVKDADYMEGKGEGMEVDNAGLEEGVEQGLAGMEVEETASLTATNPPTALPTEKPPQPPHLTLPSLPTQTPLPLPSPPILPLSSSDPLLTDRLRTLSTIREILGSEVTRSLSSVVDAEAVLREQESQRQRGRESLGDGGSLRGSLRGRGSLVEMGEGSVIVAGSENENEYENEGQAGEGLAGVGGNRHAVYGGLPDMPASTISLLQELAVDSASVSGLDSRPAGEAMQVDEPSATGATPWLRTAPTSAGPPVLALPTTTPSSATPTATPQTTTSAFPQIIASGPASATPSVRAGSRPASMVSASASASERRNSRIGNIAGRVGGWLGLGRGTEQMGSGLGAVESDTGSTAAAMPAEVAGGPTSDSAVDPGAQAGGTAPAAATAGENAGNTPAPPARHHGPLMLVQGFVQTSIARRPGPGEATTSALRPVPSSHTRANAGLPTSRPLATTVSESARPALRTRSSFTVSENATDSRLGDVSPAVAEEASANPRAGLSRRYSDGEVQLGREEATESEETGDVGEEGAAGDRRGRRGIFGRYRRANAPTPAFQEQARMLAGLLSVATAATASTLLSSGSGTSAAAGAGGDAAAGTSNAPTTAAGTATIAGPQTSQDTAPPAPASPRPHSGPRAVLETLRNRFRPISASRSGPEDNSIEAVLRDYMRHAMNPQRDLQAEVDRDGSGDVVIGQGTLRRQNGLTPQQPSLSTILPNTDPSSFEAFLNGMQLDLIRALREFNGDLSPAELEQRPESNQSAAGLDSEEAAEPMEVDPPAMAGPAETGGVPAADDADIGRQAVEAVPEAAPTIDDQQADAATVHGDGTEEAAPHNATREVEESGDQPSRLNFFRVFQFPARDMPARTPEAAAPAQPPTSLIPAVIIGVRSINRDISSIGRDDAAGAAFPFDSADDEQAATNQSAPTGATSQAQAEPAPATGAATPSPASRSSRPGASTDGSRHRRSRSSFLGALRSMGINRRSRSHGRAGDEPEPPVDPTPAVDTRNYVIWVIGGHYPAGHPILTVPRLFTGELTHDDLWALAEALGSVKPPVATKEDIAKAGLQVVKGAEIPLAVETGKVHDMCLERCLICLSDYEPEEECRVMRCRHAYHVDCIDKWLETGRNNCPACREAGVETQSTVPSEPVVAPPPDATTPHTPSTLHPAEDTQRSPSNGSHVASGLTDNIAVPIAGDDQVMTSPSGTANQLHPSAARPGDDNIARP